ncbi:MAG: YchJ family metal-binding protein [Cyanobacteria bacterium J06554_3]
MNERLNERCLCGSTRPFKRCCEPYLTGKAFAPTAEALMRSRYSAFVQGHIDYLMATHHPAHHGVNARVSLQQSIANTRWLNLAVLKTQKGQKKDKSGVVEFVAAYQAKPSLSLIKAVQNGPVDCEQMHERSHFVKEQGKWFYTTGEMLLPYVPKRSQPCWCGSGQKFQRCHGKSVLNAHT